MTTKPRAKKFRIRRTPGQDGTSADGGAHTPMPDAEAPRGAPSQDGPKVVRRPVPLKLNTEGAGNSGAAQAKPRPAPQPAASDDTPLPDPNRRTMLDDAAPEPAPRAAARKAAPQRPAQGQVASAAQVKGETNIDAIRKEGLTGRQLRMARRVAQKNGIAATSDFEAVKLLRERGIDPFERSNALELVDPRQNKQELAKRDNVQLPQTVPENKPGKNLPSKDVNMAEQRAMEIRRIQEDIASRRRRKLTLLFARLAVFVGLPTLAMGYYFAFIATPLYSTHTAFLIQQAEASSAATGGLASAFGNNQLATVQDSIAVQGYLTSREAMIRLEEEQGFKSHFQDENLDAITRLDPDATNEDAYSVYKKNVKIGYDPTEGIINMEVIAANPTASAAFAGALISYAEEQVGDLSQRLRNDQMRGARESFADAEAKRSEAATRLVDLQTRLGTVDPQGEVAAAQARIAQFETILEEKRLELDAQLANRRPNQARVDGLRSEISNLTGSIAQQKERLTQASESGDSLAAVQAQINIAQIDLQTRDAMLQQALQAMETARISAERQVRYIAIATPPTAPDKPSYPKVFENTVLAFLIFAGIYLMISLTASILREQVSS
ncbi:MAG: capsule biosynthesis protein [Pseudomonadota bacterium]